MASVMGTEIEDLRERLCNICDTCGDLYFWCPHMGVNHTVPFEEARVVAAQMLLRIRFGDALPTFVNPNNIVRDIYEVFGAEEVA